MPRKLINRFMPDHHKIRNHKCLSFLGTCLHNPALWHLNRHSVAGAFFVGLICAFIPLPFQMVMAAAMAIALQVNIPVSVVLVWVTNPLTIPPMFFFAHEVGEWILGVEDGPESFEASWDWLGQALSSHWQPFLLGCFVTGVTLGILGYVLVHLLWRAMVTYRWRNRRARSAHF